MKLRKQLLGKTFSVLCSVSLSLLEGLSDSHYYYFLHFFFVKHKFKNQGDIYVHSTLKFVFSCSNNVL